jgi:hypothetical protein
MYKIPPRRSPWAVMSKSLSNGQWKSSKLSVAANYLQSRSWHERSMGVAAMIALSQPLIIPQRLLERGFEIAAEGTDFSSRLNPDDIVAVVGYGGGIKRLIGKIQELPTLRRMGFLWERSRAKPVTFSK